MQVIVAFCAVAVTQLAWYKEDHEFFVAFSDGMLARCTRDETDPPAIIEAHEVFTCTCMTSRLAASECSNAS